MQSFERAFWYILAQAQQKSGVKNLGEQVQRSELHIPLLDDPSK